MINFHFHHQHSLPQSRTFVTTYEPTLMHHCHQCLQFTLRFTLSVAHSMDLH